MMLGFFLIETHINICHKLCPLSIIFHFPTMAFVALTLLIFHPLQSTTMPQGGAYMQPINLYEKLIISYYLQV